MSPTEVEGLRLGGAAPQGTEAEAGSKPHQPIVDACNSAKWEGFTEDQTQSC